MLPMTWPLLKMLWTVNRHAMPRLRALVDAQRDRQRVFHLRTLADLRLFYDHAAHYAKTT